ncbi:hypothetical protein GCM10023224_37040 [Streptomonospora halophila]|uniref:Uncharacterized protein n=1 Tax=Streptomonospora halophila TaxID=427369 RepID=A0ABP9GRF5_9ACTN
MTQAAPAQARGPYRRKRIRTSMGWRAAESGGPAAKGAGPRTRRFAPDWGMYAVPTRPRHRREGGGRVCVGAC